MKIYTRKGDAGTTGILGKERLDKDHLRIEAYGTIDELNSLLGLVYFEVSTQYKDLVAKLQNELFEIGTDLASEMPKNTISGKDIEHLEHLIDEFTSSTPELNLFILPGGTKASALLHVARTVSRRAERRMVSLHKETGRYETELKWINRVSDLFFVWARWENHSKNVEDVIWVSRNKS